MSIDRRRYSGGYLPLREAIDQLFEGSFITPSALGGSGGFPTADMHVNDDEVIVHMAIPGANPNDINISVTGETVTISGEVKSEHHSQKGQPYFEEIWRGRFQRSFQLPTQVDANKADASYNNGVLTLTLPKSEATKPRKIQVKQGQQTLDQPGQSGQGQVETEKVAVHGGGTS
ncbi:MAG TPA: Hsp20/alpha crystallin family protein [Chloroflexota bacterium]|nr:Hsp20/alpha crystallin family protein [Chloroflexota bacterium]